MLRSIKIPYKLTAIGLAFGLPMAVMLAFIVSGINDRIDFAGKEIYGNLYQRPLERILQDITLYNHLIHEKITGGASFEPADKIRQAESTIDNDFKSLLEVDKAYGKILGFTDEGLRRRGRPNASPIKVKNTWESLKKNVNKTPVDKKEIHEIFKILITDLRAMITHSGDNSNLILDPDLDSYYLMDVTLLALPEAQDRLAVIISEADDVKPVFTNNGGGIDGRIEAAVTASKVRADMERTIASVGVALNEDANFYGKSETLQTAIKPRLDAYVRASQRVIDELESIAKGTTESKDTKALSSAALEASRESFDLWRTSAEELDILLKKRITYFRTYMNAALGLSGLALAIAVFLVVLITRSITVPLKRLEAGTAKMASGAYDLAVEVDGYDELAMLASSFNLMASRVAEYSENMETQVKSRTAELQQAYNDLKELDEMKSTFLSTVSHELRTPLTSVLGFAKIIKNKFDSLIAPNVDTSHKKTQKAVKQINENLDIIVSEGMRLTNLINDVLDLAKMEAGKIEWRCEAVKVSELIDRASAATYALFHQKELRFIKEIPEDLPIIEVDHDRILQVIINLLSNAVKFTPKDGTVTVKAIVEDDYLRLSVTDTGVGIKAEDHAGVFEKFKQLGDTLVDKPKGTGLGLPICKQIIEHHRGRIWVESEHGIGSTFIFTIPLIEKTLIEIPDALSLFDELKQRVAGLRHITHDKSDGLKTILIVDDDRSIRELIKCELNMDGCRIMEAQNGMEALDSIRKDRPDLIILDVMMPGMSGFDVAAIVKNDPQTASIPIVILSVLEDKTRGFRIGVDRYLTKPFKTEELHGAVNELLATGESPKRVLLVDENATTINIIADALKSGGYGIIGNCNGNECIEYALRERPDMIILDSMLTNRHEILSALRFQKGMENVLFIVLDGRST